MSKDEIRCVKTARSQVTVGELYRWILAKLSDKDIKRALHKYRDLMPRQSDWNRKLTQATNIPELGFRYLYRCGQIDESNHRTMQKMLKYIDRQDVLPYFDTILYNTNMSNASIDQLKHCLRDKVMDFIALCDRSEFNKVSIGSPYTISQCQPLTNLRLTRSVRKRLSNGECSQCLTTVKRPHLDITEAATSGSGASVPPVVELNEIRLKKELSNEAFASKLFQCLRQSRQRYRNIPLLHNYSLPGVIEAPIQVLLQSTSHISNRDSDPVAAVAGEPVNPSIENSTSGSLDADDSRFVDNIREVYDTKEKDLVTGFYYAKIRLKIRMDSGNYLDEMEALHSNRTNPVDRQMDIIAQTISFLRDREAGEMLCELRCTQVEQLDCLWRDYQTGELKKRLCEMLLPGNDAPASVTTAAASSVTAQLSIPIATGAMAPSLSTLTSAIARQQNLRLHLFISRHEYESCRAVLMRNLYPVYVHQHQQQPLASSLTGAAHLSSTTIPPPVGSTLPPAANGGATGHSDAPATGALTAGAQRFSAVQHLIAHLREVPPQMNMWSIHPHRAPLPPPPPPPPAISVANRPVFMHMFYPQDSFIPVTVNPVLRPIHLMSGPAFHQQASQSSASSSAAVQTTPSASTAGLQNSSGSGSRLYQQPNSQQQRDFTSAVQLLQQQQHHHHQQQQQTSQQHATTNPSSNFP